MHINILAFHPKYNDEKICETRGI